MLTFKSFSGINNVMRPERLGADALQQATDVDIDVTGQISRRKGYASVSLEAHRSLFDAGDFLLATVGINGDLTAISGETRTTIYPSLGHERVWYCTLPDGRIAFSNGLICGLTDGTIYTGWGVPVPAGVGAAMGIPGNLFDGEYRWQITYVRLADGREGGPAYSEPISITEGGLFLSGLPVLAGYKINVYLTSHNDVGAYLAGSTTNAIFSFTGKNDELVQPCRTDFCKPAPAGICPTSWRGRALIAEGNVLYASRPNDWETFDVRRDYKQFVDPITLVVPVDDGIYVGTEKELSFLAGSQFDQLVYRLVVNGGTVLGSGVPVPGELVKQGEGAGQGSAMLCIADGRIIAGFNGGGITRLTENVYHTAVTEVHAHFRNHNGTPQYIATPQ